MRLLTILSVCFFAFSHGKSLAAPPLPSGLTKQKTSPALPSGLDNKPALPAGLKPALSPALPSGLSKNSENKFKTVESEEPFVNVSGFFDMRGGIRTQNDPNQRQLSLGETRLQIALQKDIGSVSVNVITDVLYDATVNSYDIALDKGRGWIDLREANFAVSPFSFIDLKVGRQILTWGTGDLIFINDLFPKDWQAFFTGRDLKYLKAPSDSVKSSFFSDYGNVDFIYTPWFDADRGITGEKISFFSPNAGGLVGNAAIIKPERPYSEEFAVRIYKNIGVSELALYGYHGFWKSPVGFNASTGNPRYPKMRSLGASIRRPVWQGIANIEVGYYDSYEQGSSSNPFTPNSEARFLIGYEQEVVKNFSVGMQYYVEWMQDYRHYLAGTNSIGAPALRDEVRHLITNRLTLMTHQQNVSWSLFTFYSPSDQDAYFRPKVAYKVTDAWQVEVGGNFFVGKIQSTFFGQFEKNNNVFGSVRYSF